MTVFRVAGLSKDSDWRKTSVLRRIGFVFAAALTHGFIRNLVAENALNELTRLVLVNAIYLKAPWAEPFQASATKSGAFYVNEGTT